MSEENLYNSSDEELHQKPKKKKKRSRKKSDSSVSGEKGETKSEKRRKKYSRSSSRVAPSVSSKDVKYRLTFLMDQPFKGEFYKKDQTLEVDAHIYEAYKGRVNMLRFEAL